MTVELRLQSDLWPTFADANQLEAAVLNLVVNARDAMPSGGRLTLATANQSIAASAANCMDDIRPGDYVTLTVSDTGTGMAPDVMAHVFEPFFTTKDVGHGTGLGLAMVFGFVKQSLGGVRIESELGRGTSVIIHLPRQCGHSQLTAPQSGRLSRKPGLDLPPKSTAGSTILVVEDSDEVRNTVQDSLEALGYRVVTVSDVNDALALLQSGAAPVVDLLFTDINLPGGINGLELAKQVARRWPKLPVLLTTGYTDLLEAKAMRAYAHDRLLNKPYSLHELDRVLREVLTAEVSASREARG